MHESEWEFEPNARSVGAARRLVRAALDDAGAGENGWAVAHVVSELATNAVVHAATHFVVRVRVEDSHVRVEVTDNVPHARAARRQFSSQATTGRGLQLIEELGDAWGVEVDGATKTIWCEVNRVPGASGKGVRDGSPGRGAGAGGSRGVGRRAPARPSSADRGSRDVTSVAGPGITCADRVERPTSAPAVGSVSTPSLAA